MSGIERIGAERKRQIEVEDWTSEHDAEHAKGELIEAAILYARAAAIVEHHPIVAAAVERTMRRYSPDIDPEDDEDYQRMLANPARHHFGWNQVPRDWPWAEWWWKPSPDAIRNLEKAGALIAAEIDRLAALEHSGISNEPFKPSTR